MATGRDSHDDPVTIRSRCGYDRFAGRAGRDRPALPAAVDPG